MLFADGKMNSYWFGSGTPTYLIEMLNKYGVAPQQIGGRKVFATAFDAPTERMTDITPLLYQSGYVTIKDYSSLTMLYTLDIPNKEVRIGLMQSLLANYLHRYTNDGLTTVALLYEAIVEERLARCPAACCRLSFPPFPSATIPIMRVIINPCSMSYSVFWVCTSMWRYAHLVVV